MGDSEVSHHAQITPTNDETVNRLAKSILAFLSVQGAATAASIRKLVKGRKVYKARALRELQRSGEVLRIGSGRKCDPFRYRNVNHKAPQPPLAPSPTSISAPQYAEEVIL